MVYILLADGFEEAEALVPADLLRRAGIDTALVSLWGSEAVGGRGVLGLRPDPGGDSGRNRKSKRGAPWRLLLIRRKSSCEAMSPGS